MKTRKIHSQDHCAYCGHKGGIEEDAPFRVYSEKRARWLEFATKYLGRNIGDEEWLQWVKEGEELSNSGQ